MPTGTNESVLHNVVVHADRVALIGDLTIPDRPKGLIVFAHGSGSGRQSPRNQRVASSLVHAGFATLLFDLLTIAEENAHHYTGHLRFEIPMLARRLVGAIQWARRMPRIGTLPVGVFGASTGSAAALVAASRAPEIVAVVSRGGRPDLAGQALWLVECPTLLIVGGNDTEVLELNRRALEQMHAPAVLHIVPGATHLFEEVGALEDVTELATSWFERHLVDRRTSQHQPASHP